MPSVSLPFVIVLLLCLVLVRLSGKATGNSGCLSRASRTKPTWAVLLVSFAPADDAAGECINHESHAEAKGPGGRAARARHLGAELDRTTNRMVVLLTLDEGLHVKAGTNRTSRRIAAPHDPMIRHRARLHRTHAKRLICQQSDQPRP